jgi:rhodanese-related sulfurtransferase
VTAGTVLPMFGRPSIPSLTAHDLAAELAAAPAAGTGGVFVLDVREDDEWRGGHIEGAVHVPLMDLPVRLPEVPTDRPVAVVCRVGSRSAQATSWLADQGYDVRNVDGGMVAWFAASLPAVADGDAEPTVV